MEEKEMCVWARVLASQIRKKKAKGDSLDKIKEKINVFYAAEELTDEEYQYLTGMIGE